MSIKVFISHDARERELAEAWQTLLKKVTYSTVEAWFSSDPQPTGGVTGDWRRDLNRRLSTYDFILAIQTPLSHSRPWIMWECGVVAGRMGDKDAIYPIAYSIERNGLKNPLESYTVFSGEDPEQVRKVCALLGKEAGLTLELEDIQDSHIQTYLDVVKAYLNAMEAFNLHKTIGKDQIDSWRREFEQLLQDGRADEIADLRQRMYTSLPKPFTPIDPVFHLFLSERLLGQKNLIEAKEEIDYALHLDKDDTRFLYQQALVLVELGELHSAEEAIERLFALKRVLRADPEYAGLEGRIHRELWIVNEDPEELDKALTAYQRAYESDRMRRYYAGINFAELALAKDNHSLAEQTLQNVLAVCQKLQDEPTVSFWVDFTAGNAYLGLGNVQAAMAGYSKGFTRARSPLPRERESAAKGALRMARLKKLPDDVMEEIKKLFRI